MRIALGSDHAGFDLKSLLVATLLERGHDVLDLGTDSDSVSVDYPDFGAAVGRSVVSGESDLGVAICGTGIGMSIAANKVPGVRAAVVHDVSSARLAREHNHANILCMGARLIGSVTAADALDAWLTSPLGEGRHLRRIEKIAALDEQAQL